MADTKVSGFTAASALDGSELIAGVQSGANRKITPDQIATRVAAANNVTSGTYTPTLTNTTNVAASTAYVCQYIRVGAVVHVSGKVDVDATLAAGTATVLGISLPVASDFASEQQCAGVASTVAVASQTAIIKGDATNNRALLNLLALSLSNDSYFFSFTYLIV